MTEEQIQAIKCAYADLKGALEARNQCDIEAHDWKSHYQSICDLLRSFSFLEE